MPSGARTSQLPPPAARTFADRATSVTRRIRRAITTILSPEATSADPSSAGLRQEPHPEGRRDCEPGPECDPTTEAEATRHQHHQERGHELHTAGGVEER